MNRVKQPNGSIKYVTYDGSEFGSLAEALEWEACLDCAWVDENKLFRMSRGKCLCQSQKEMENCKYYMPWRGAYQPDMCVWLDKWTGTICLCQEEEK